MLQQAWNINNEGDAAIAGNRCPGHPGRALQGMAQGFDHYFFLTNQLVNHEAHTVSAHRNNHHVTVAGFRCAATPDQPALDVKYREHLVSDHDTLAAVDHILLAQVQVKNFHHI